MATYTRRVEQYVHTETVVLYEGEEVPGSRVVNDDIVFSDVLESEDLTDEEGAEYLAMSR